MSSLAAARADNFYYAHDFDPKKHGSLNKYNGQHPLRERAKKLESEGILVIRFEVPFNIWCDKCGEMIGKGVRFNAEKKQVGSYHSTKIWAFSMRHHCGSRITITTDPKNAEYVVTEGAQRKVESYTAEDAETVELPDRAEAAAVAADPLSKLERDTMHAAAAREGRAQLTALVEDNLDKHKDEYSLNKQLRRRLRAAKKEDAAVDAKRKALGLPDHITLAPESAADAQAAQLAFFADNSNKFVHNWQGKRRKIMTESIFGSAAGAALPPTSTHSRHSSTVAAQKAASRHDRHAVAASSSGRNAPALGQGPAMGAALGRAQAAKQELQQRVLAAAGKKRSLADRAAQQLDSRQRLPPTLVARRASG